MAFLFRFRRSRSPLAQLSRSIEAIVSGLAPSVVALDADGRPLGSGTIVGPGGLVATSDDVLPEGGGPMAATLADGRRADARLVRLDGAAGLAFLRVDAAADLPAARLEPRMPPAVGSIVVAIGRTPSMGPSAALGVVSSLGRAPNAPFATDARASLDLAGGALCAASGRLIGVASVLASGAVGGVPAARVEASLARLPSRAPSIGLGAWDQMLDEPVAARLGVDGPGGILVIEVHPGGGAERAGLRPLDVIVRANGRRMRSIDDFARAIDREAVGGGEPLRIQAIRGEELVSVTLAPGWSRVCDP